MTINYINELTRLNIHADLHQYYVEAMKSYEQRYGKLLRIPDRYHSHYRLTSIDMGRFAAALGLLAIQPNEPNYYWLAKLYFALPLPRNWVQVTSLTGDIQYKHSCGHSSTVRPSLLYVLRTKWSIAHNSDIKKKMEALVRFNYFNFIHLYKNPYNGQYVNINIKKYLFEHDEGEKLGNKKEVSLNRPSSGCNRRERLSSGHRQVKTKLKQAFDDTLRDTKVRLSTRQGDSNGTYKLRRFVLSSIDANSKRRKARDSANLTHESNASENPKPAHILAFDNNTKRDLFFVRLKKTACKNNSVNRAITAKVNRTTVDRYVADNAAKPNRKSTLYDNRQLVDLHNGLLTKGVKIDVRKLCNSLGKVSCKRESEKVPQTGASLLSIG